MGVIEIAVVIGVAHGQARDDRSGQVLGIGLPLLAGVILDEGLVQRAPDEADALVIEVLRILAGQLAGLLGNNSASLIRGVGGGEELVDGAQIDRHGVHHTVMSGVNVMHVWSERREAVDVLPHALIGRVEQMGAVLVNLDTGTRIRLGVGVTADVVALVDDKHLESELVGASLRDRQAEQARSDNDEVVVHRNCPSVGNGPMVADSAPALRSRLALIFRL